MGRMYIKWWSYSWLRLTCLFRLLVHGSGPFCGRQAVFRHFVHEKGAFCGQHVLPNWSFDAEYEHDISVLCSKSMYYRQGLFVDPTPEYGLRTRPFVSYCMPVLYEDNMFVVRCCQGEVRKENASRSVGQGSHAHMSGEMQRYGGLNLYGLVM